MKFLNGINPREYQQKIFETCTEKNCLVVLPTGLGKTLIAIMLTIQRMRQYPGEKVVLLAPTKPLVEQHFKSFKKHLPELFAEMQIFTGSINAEKRKKIWQNTDIIFSTPQCVANDIKKNFYNFEEVCLLIEDEAHRCVKNYDYNFIAQKYSSQSKHPRILGLTASPGNDKQKIKEICKNLSIQEVELRTRYSADVKTYLQEIEIEKIEVDFPSEFLEIKEILNEIFNEYINELKNRKVLFSNTSKTELINLQSRMIKNLSKERNFNYMLALSSCAQAIKISHAIELLETQTLEVFNKYLKNLFEQAKNKKSRGIQKMVSKPQFGFIFSKTQEMIEKNKEHPKIEKIIEIIKKEMKKNKKLRIIIFTQFRDTCSQISKKVNEITGIKSKVFIGQAKKKSESETNGLSQKQQKDIIKEFSEGSINIICATSIAEEGLDIPEVNAVIFYESVPSAIRVIQRAGRTGRLKPGKIIMLITKKTRDETFYYVSKGKQKKMQSAIDTIKKELSENKKIEFQEKLK